MSLREAGVSLIDCDHRTPPPSETGYPYIAIPQLKQGHLDLSDVRRITREHFHEWTRKAKPQANDVVLSRRCNPGETAVVPADLECALGQNLVLLRADAASMFPPFLRWLVRGVDWWEQIGKFLNVGAVFDSLKCVDIPYFQLPIPPLPEQRAIASVLGALDDKIELNRRMNETLEAMAQALFQNWFVDATQASLPKGWRESTLGELIQLAYGKALKAQDRQPGEIPVFGSNGQVGWHNEKLVDGPGIVVGRKGNPGIVTWSPTSFFPIDTTFYVVPKGECRSLYFLFYVLLAHDLASLGADSAVPGLNRNMAYLSQQVLPAPDVLEMFDGIVKPIFEKIHANAEESRTLAAIRDALLPKLLSGELRLNASKQELAAHA